jgi:hypothetical protein
MKLKEGQTITISGRANGDGHYAELTKGIENEETCLCIGIGNTVEDCLEQIKREIVRLSIPVHQVHQSPEVERLAWSFGEAAESVGLNHQALREIAERDSAFPVMRLGNKKRIPIKEFQQWLADQVGETIMTVPMTTEIQERLARIKGK